jgi:membrane fusion protein, multidrug efflux system
MKNKRRIIILILLVVVIVIIILPKINFSGKNDKENNTQNHNTRKVVVDGVVVKTVPFQNKIYSNGTLISNEEVELRSEITGKITKILFEEGKKVKQGELLVKINDSDLQATLKKNKARESLARDKEYRLKQLLEKNLTSQAEYDVALSDLNSIVADVEFTKAQIEKTELRAPFDGIIGLRTVSVGSYISPENRIAALQSINPIKAGFAIPQKYFGFIKEGKNIYVRLASSGKTYIGKIYAVEPKIDESTRNVRARALISNERGELTPGSYVEIDIVLEDLKDAVLVPTDLIVPNIEGENVFVYKNGTAVLRKVTTGIRTDKEIQVISGLNRGDTLIVSGIIQLRPDMPVKLKSIN